MNRSNTKNVAAPETKELMLTSPASMGEDGAVKGLAAAFGNLDRHGDIILPTAFDKALGAMRNADEVAFLWNHDSSKPLGPLRSLSVTDDGLEFDGTIVPTTWGKDVRMLLKTKTVRKMSFGYRVNRAAYVDDAVGLASALSHFGVDPRWSGSISAEAAKAFDAGMGVRLLVDLDPWEVSLVPVPANPRAELAAKGIAPDEAKGAAPFRDYAFAPLGYEWDADNAVARVKRWAGADDEPNAAYRSAFAWYDSENESQFGAYRLPIADVIEGSLVIVPAAVYEAAQAVEDGSAGIPEGDVDRVKGLLSRYYAAIADRFSDSSIIPPWDAPSVKDGLGLTLLDGITENAGGAEPPEAKAGRMLSKANASRLRELRSALAEGVKALDDLFAIAGLMEDMRPDEDEDEDDMKNITAEHATPADLVGLFRFA
jgi:HK97 family phage prohead protease